MEANRSAHRISVFSACFLATTKLLFSFANNASADAAKQLPFSTEKSTLGGDLALKAGAALALQFFLFPSLLESERSSSTIFRALFDLQMVAQTAFGKHCLTKQR